MNQFFWPDAAATSQLLTDVTRVLAAEGHEIEVLCGRSNYATVDVLDDPPPIKIHRLFSAPFVRGRIGRSVSYVSFLLGCLWKGLRMRKVDLIITMTTPPFLPVVGAILQRIRGKRHLIWVMDLFPEALVDIGIFRAKSPIIRVLHWISDWSYSRADAVILIGECMLRRLVEREIPRQKLFVAENWADGREIFPIARCHEAALELMYSGNLGLSHDVETILFAIEMLREDQRFHFRFVGTGQKLIQVQQFCLNHGAQNVSFMPHCSRSRLAESFSKADIGLVTQRPTSAGSVVPSKVYGLMAAGKPILYIGPRNTTSFQMIQRHQCGWQIDCGDGRGLVALIEELHARKDLVVAAGARAREAFLQYYDLPIGVPRICSLINAVGAGNQPIHDPAT